jgi:hypothetical protein
MSSENLRPWDLFKKNEPRALEDVRKQRLEICKSCEHFIKITHQCTKCGCFMDLKTKLRTATCPINKW